VDPAGPSVEEPLQGRSRLVREESSLATGKYGSHPLPLDREIAPPDGVDAAMDRMKPAARDAPANCAPAETKGHQLLECHHTVLGGSEGDDEPVGLAPRVPRISIRRTMVGLRSTMGRFSPIAEHGAMVAVKASRVARAVCA